MNNEKFFQNNKSARIVTCILLCIPIIIAVILYVAIDPNVVETKALTSLTVIANGVELNFDESDKDEMELYSSITENAEPVTLTEKDFAGETPCEVRFIENGGAEVVYYLYMNTDVSKCVYKNSDGQYFRMDPQIAEKLLEKFDLIKVNSQTFVPTMSFTRGSKTVSLKPSSYNWSYKNDYGEYIETKSSVSVKNPVLYMNQSDMGKFAFTIKSNDNFIDADKVEYEISNPNTSTASSTGLLEELSQNIEMKHEYASDTPLKLKLTATWNDLEDVEEDYYGVMNYEFDIMYDIEPTYTLVDKSLRRGDFTILKVANFNKGETLEVTNDFGLMSPAKVYHNQETGEDFMFIPLSSQTAVGDRKFTLKTQSGDVKEVTITARNEKTAYKTQTVIVTESEPELQASFTKQAFEEWEKTVAELTAQSPDSQSWKLGKANKFDYPVANTPAKGAPEFGTARDVQSVYYSTNKNNPEIAYYFDGVSLAAQKGDVVKASEAGKVVFAGELELFGKLVAVDHGSGILTYYGHLSDISVKVGESVTRGQELGKAGSTGFACDDTIEGGAKRITMVYFAVSFGGSFVDPASPCTWGINF